MSLELNTGDEALTQWVTFQLAGETYGINVTQVKEVIRLTEISPVPGAPDYVLGIINLRGVVVSVIDTRRRFGLAPRESTDDSRIVMIEMDGHIIGVLVDSVSEVVDLPKAEIDAAPNAGNADASRYIQGVTTLDGKLLILVDLNRLFSEEELLEVTNL